jgi:hypothetical protein
MSEEEGWSLILQFPDGSPSFVHGFEAGRLWHRLEIEYEPIEQMINVENREIVVRMAAAKGWTVEFEDRLAGIWLNVKLERGRGPTLRVVD